MKKFRTHEGVTVLPHVYVNDIRNKYSNVEIHIGTDSQNKGRKTYYATVIAFKYGHRGVHYIWSLESFPRIRDLWSRLWKEAELSINTAKFISDRINVSINIDMDYSSDIVRKSNMLVNSAKGWAESLGYSVNIKPDNQIATKAADYHCR